MDQPELPFGVPDETPPTSPHAMSRSSDPDTSKKAAKRASYRTGSQKARLLEVYVNCYPWALSDAEAARRAGFEPLRGLWKRCSDLRNEGYIIRVGTSRSRDGDDVMTCRYLPEAER